MLAILTRPRTLIHASGEVLWEKGAPTEMGCHVYTTGDCWALAWAIARRIEPVLGKGRIFTLGWWDHVVVQIGEDLFLDVEGTFTRAGITDRWARRLVPVAAETETSFEHYRDELAADWGFYGEDRAAADAMALLLLEAHAPHLLAI